MKSEVGKSSEFKKVHSSQFEKVHSSQFESSLTTVIIHLCQFVIFRRENCELSNYELAGTKN